ncbi:hypothetical protein [Cryptosporidium hominis TU502]|uniref:hypothetical protein n=1 Tax=Cryptosporidium hominis (strain TU502) TaxID=353151 RepID=UPI0000453208|nr:hypothetical protein [Cryptosporidium hominis TU502]
MFKTKRENIIYKPYQFFLIEKLYGYYYCHSLFNYLSLFPSISHPFTLSSLLPLSPPFSFIYIACFGGKTHAILIYSFQINI